MRTIRSEIQLAKDSLSQRSSHQAMVTRSPNHMWAISWAMMLARRRRWLKEGFSASINSARSV